MSFFSFLSKALFPPKPPVTPPKQVAFMYCYQYFQGNIIAIDENENIAVEFLYNDRKQTIVIYYYERNFRKVVFIP